MKAHGWYDLCGNRTNVRQTETTAQVRHIRSVTYMAYFFFFLFYFHALIMALAQRLNELATANSEGLLKYAVALCAHRCIL